MTGTYRKIAAWLMLLSGVTHPAQMLYYGTAPEIRSPALTGMVFLLVGAGLLTQSRKALWWAVAVPFVLGLGAVYRIVADIPVVPSYFHAAIDFTVVGLAIACLRERTAPAGTGEAPA